MRSLLRTLALYNFRHSKQPSNLSPLWPRHQHVECGCRNYGNGMLFNDEEQSKDQFNKHCCCCCCWKEVLGSITSWSLPFAPLGGRCLPPVSQCKPLSPPLSSSLPFSESNHADFRIQLPKPPPPRPFGLGIFIWAHFDYFLLFNGANILPPCFLNRISSAGTQHLLFLQTLYAASESSNNTNLIHFLDWIWIKN